MAVVELSPSDGGQSISVHPGDEILIRLPENPTTGFRWEVDSADPIVTSVGDEFELGQPATVGSGGTRVLRFRVATSTGIGRLTLKLRQPWEGDASVTDSFSIDLEVEP